MEDSLSVTVTTAQGSGNFANYFRGEIEEDTWHKAILKEITPCEGSYKGNKYPAWSWVYELQGDDFTIENKDKEEVQAQVLEKTSQKFTGHPRTSRAYERYCQLTGGEPEPGDNVSLKELFGVVCKVMIKNADSGKTTKDDEPIIYHNIEKVSVKGLKKDEEITESKPKKKVLKKKNKEEEPEEPEEKEEKKDKDDDIFSDIF